jgi:hypothetical protein
MTVLPTKEEIDAEHRRLRAEYGALFDDVAAIFFRHDPIGINFEDNTDEYEPEASTILPRLRTCHSPEDVLTVVHEEFQRWFDPDIAGAREKYSTIANDVWALWRKSPLADAT